MTVRQRGTKRNASNGYGDSRPPKQNRLSSDSESEDADTGVLNMHERRDWSAGPGGGQEGNDRVSQM